MVHFLLEWFKVQEENILYLPHIYAFRCSSLHFVDPDFCWSCSSAWEIFFIIFYNTGLLVIKPFIFCMYEKSLFFPSLLKCTFTKNSRLMFCVGFGFSVLKVFHCLRACIVSCRDAAILKALHIMSFSVAALRFSLYHWF